MRTSNFILITSLFLYGCETPGNPAAVAKKNMDSLQFPKIDSNQPINKIVKDTIPDFLEIAKGTKDASRSYLPGVENSDSSGPYVVKEFITNKFSFDLLFYPRDGNKDAVNFDVIHKANADNYKNFICFAFVFPMIDPDTMKDYHDVNITFPVIIKSFVRENMSWAFMSQTRAMNLTELTRFEIKSIYSKVH